MRTHRPVPIESRALGTLSYIRSSIDAASSLAVPGIIMGGIFVVLGLVTFTLPAAAHTWALGAGFGALHLLTGILIGRINHGE